MLRTTLEQWRMFQAVAVAGGFNQAASQVHKSQSSIHHAVNKLEESLGLKLFEVVGRRAKLTSAGEQMLRRANYLLDEALKLESLAGSFGDGVEAELNIAADRAFPYELVYQAINRVSAEYALLCINLHETALSGANELLTTQQVNLAISPFTLPDCLNEELVQVRFTAVANPEHALHRLERELDVADLKAYRQIVVRDSAEFEASDDGWLGAESRWTVDHFSTSLDLVCRGLGFAWLPDQFISERLESGQLRPLPLGKATHRQVSFYLNFIDADQLGPAARSFVGELRHLTL